MAKRPKVCPHLLLVEGNEDLKTIPYLMEANGIDWPSPSEAPVWIEQYEGYSNLLRSDVIKSEMGTSGLQALGIMIDADENAVDRWEEVRRACLPVIPNLPENLPESGLIYKTMDADEKVIRFGVWMMPNNISPGMLETFLGLMIPESSERLWEYAQAATTEAKNRGALFSPSHTDKANLYTWLAWQRPPGEPFPYALKDKILEPTRADVQTFVTWFKTLYGL
jgi:hypothetical protein